MSLEEEISKPKRRMGFAAMDRETVRAMARKGGLAAVASGNGHQYSSDEAREAGRKGGAASAAAKRARKAVAE